MEILSNENSFVKIILNKIIENNKEKKKIVFYANICEQLCYKLNEEINLNNEDLKTILAEESKNKFNLDAEKSLSNAL